MNGYNEDIISILRDNVLLHGEALGLVLSDGQTERTNELISELRSRKLPISSGVDKIVVLYDYVIIGQEWVCVPALLQAMALLKIGGVVVMDISDWTTKPRSAYRMSFGNFSVTPLRYGDDRYYLVVHGGSDYGN